MNAEHKLEQRLALDVIHEAVVFVLQSREQPHPEPHFPRRLQRLRRAQAHAYRLCLAVYHTREIHDNIPVRASWG